MLAIEATKYENSKIQLAKFTNFIKSLQEEQVIQAWTNTLFINKTE